MQNLHHKRRQVTRLGKDDKPPYHLLLLADETMEAIERYIHKSDIYVLREGDEIIGVYVLQEVNDDCVEIKNIAVDEKFQLKGFGQFLLEDACDKARLAGFQTIIVGTGDGSVGELTFYQKSGFERFDIRKDFFVINYPNPIFENGMQLRDMVVLRKNLS